MKRHIFKKLSAIFLVSILIFTGCSSSGGNSSAEENHLNFGLTGEPVSMDPSIGNEQNSWQVYYQIFDTLIFRENDGTYSPRLAEKWEMSEDGMELTFWLRDDVNFHNGEKFTAEDVKFTVERLLESPYTSDIVIGIKGAEIIDDYTIKIIMEHPYGAILDCIAEVNFSIVCKKAVEEDEEGYARNPVGTGPYKFSEWSTGEKIEVVAFDDYYRGRASIDGITFKIMNDTSTAAIALERGELDILPRVALTDKNSLTENEEIKWYETDLAGSTFVIFNYQKGPFSKREVRQAVGYAIDKEAMLQGASEGQGTVIQSILPPACFGYSEDFVGSEYDPEKAKALLAEAGYPNGFSAVLKTNEDPMYYKPAEILQGQLSQIGINLEIEKMERGAFFTDAYGGNFEISVFNTTCPVPDADSILHFYFHSSQIEAGCNLGYVNNAEFDQILTKAQQSTDADERMELYNKANEIVRDDGICVPLYASKAAIAASKDLKGVEADPIYKCYVYDFSW